MQVNWTHNFRKAQQWEIKTLPDLEIVFLKASPDEEKIGLLLGRRLKKNKVEIAQLMVFKRDLKGKWQLEVHLDYSFNSSTCAQFTFKASDPTKLLMISRSSVFEFDYQAPASSRVNEIYLIEN